MFRIQAHQHVADDLRIALGRPEKETLMQKIPLLFEERDVGFHLLPGHLFVEHKPAFPCEP